MAEGGRGWCSGTHARACWCSQRGRPQQVTPAARWWFRVSSGTKDGATPALGRLVATDAVGGSLLLSGAVCKEGGLGLKLWGVCTLEAVSSEKDH